MQIAGGDFAGDLAEVTAGWPELPEIRRGILENPRGKKRDALEAWFSGPEGPRELFTGRILSFDDKAGLI